MITPTLPHIESLTGRALMRLLSGRHITHRDFQNETATYRLAANIEHLRNRLGWPIASYWEEGPTRDKTARRARYVRYRIEAGDLVELKKLLGPRLDKFIQAVKRYEGAV